MTNTFLHDKLRDFHLFWTYIHNLLQMLFETISDPTPFRQQSSSTRNFVNAAAGILVDHIDRPDQPDCRHLPQQTFNTPDF